VHHRVRIKDSALVAAAVLSHRYIADRFLPDKAIDLVDEAAAKIKMESDSMPAEIDAVTRKLTQLQIEAQAEVVREHIHDMQAAQRGKTHRWPHVIREHEECRAVRQLSEKEVIDQIRKAQPEIEKLRHAAEEAQRRGDLGQAAEISYGKIPELEKRIEELRKTLARVQEKTSYLREEVTDHDIAAIVSKWTGIPVAKMMRGEMHKLLQMEEELKKRVIGRRPRSRPSQMRCAGPARVWAIRNRPIGSFPFSDLPAWARPSSPGRSRSFSLTTNAP
jgi:ATP-dependent Clp protease ATP-binding subunit ClpB